MEQLNKMIEQIVWRSGSSVHVEIMDFFPGNRVVGGKYNLGSHKITLYIEEIKKQCTMLFSSMDCYMDYFAVVLAHELGHAEDKELEALADRRDETENEAEKRMISLKIEENAWYFARNLMTDIDESFLNKIIDHSLEGYRGEITGETA